MDRSKWEYKKLCDVALITLGQSPSSDSYNEEGKGLPFFQGNADFGILHPKVRVYCDAPQREANENDILMSVRAPIGAINIANTHCCIGRGLCAITPQERCLDLKYLYYFLISKNGYLNQQGTGSTFKSISKKIIFDLSIPVPSLADQQSISGEIDCLNEMIALKQEQLKEFDKLAQSIFYDMFGDPISNEKGWEKSSYGNEFVIGSGGTPSKSVAEYWEKGDIPWIGSNMCQNCDIYDNDGKYITQRGLDNSSAKVLKKGTVLIALVGATIGKVGLLHKEMATNQNVAYINAWASGVFDPTFVFYHSMKLYQLFLNLGNGGFKMANQGFIKELPIILPPLTLQQQFAEKIQAIEAQKELVKQSIAETQSLFNSRMDYYFN